nr:oligopeptide transporter 4-like [Tanacetum cinerariifolium]
LNDLDNATLHIDGQSTEVDVPPDIIDVVDKDDDITDDEDALPHDLADSDNEDLINVDDDGVDKMLADVARSYGGDGRDEDRPLHTMYPVVLWVALLNETQFDLRPHMESPEWTEINADIQQHLQKAYNTNKAALKAQHWVIDPTTGTYNVEKIRRAHHENITASEWDKGRAQPLKSTRRSLTPSSWHTLLTGNSFRMRTDEEMRRLEATSTYTDYEINRLARGGKQRGHIPNVGRVLLVRATASPSTPAHERTLNSLHKKVDFMMSLFKSKSKYSDMFSQFESGGASGSGGCGDDEEGFGTGLRSFPDDMSSGNMCHRGTNFLTGKYVGPTVLLGIVAGEGIPCERSPANIPRRQVTGETYPQRHVAGESPELSLGNGLNEYDITKIVNSKFEIDYIEYGKQGKVNLSTFFDLTYGFGFATIASTLTHVGLFYGKEIYQRYKASTKAALAFGVTLPISIITATTNQTSGLNIITEYAMGLIYPGKPIANVCFKTYGYMSMTQAISFLSDFKLGHYMKIPPRSMFLVHVHMLSISAYAVAHKEHHGEECPIEEHVEEESLIEEHINEESPVEEHDDEESPIEEHVDEKCRIEEHDDEESPIEEHDDEESPIEEHDDDESPIEEPDDEESPIEEHVDEESLIEEHDEESPIEEHVDEESPIEEHVDEKCRIEEHDDEESPIEEHVDEKCRIEEHDDEESPIEEHDDEESPIEEHDDDESPIEEPDDEESPIEEHVDEESLIEEHDEESPIEEHVDEESPIEEHDDEESLIEEHVYKESPIEEHDNEQSLIEEHVYKESPIEEHDNEQSLIEEHVDEESPIEEHVDEESPIEEPDIEESPIEEVRSTILTTNDSTQSV